MIIEPLCLLRPIKPRSWTEWLAVVVLRGCLHFETVRDPQYVAACSTGAIGKSASGQSRHGGAQGLKVSSRSSSPYLQFGCPERSRWDPCTSLTRCSLGCTPKCTIDTGLAELGAPHDFRDGRTVFPQ